MEWEKIVLGDSRRRRLLVKTLLLGFLLGAVVPMGCSDDPKPDFLISLCEETEEETTAAYDAARGDQVDPPEGGSINDGLTCIAFQTISDDEIEIDVINYWNVCDEYGGNIHSQGQNQFEIEIVDIDPDVSWDCLCPIDFTFSLNINPDIDTLTVAVVPFEADFDLTEDSGIVCWANEYYGEYNDDDTDADGGPDGG